MRRSEANVTVTSRLTDIGPDIERQPSLALSNHQTAPPLAATRYAVVSKPGAGKGKGAPVDDATYSGYAASPAGAGAGDMDEGMYVIMNKSER